MSDKLNLNLKVWRQNTSNEEGGFVDYEMNEINSHMSFLELLDVLNERLIEEGDNPIALSLIHI